MKIGLQLYTLRDVMAADFNGTLRQVAEMGYEGVEFAGYGGASAEDMRDLLKELGIEAFGSHVSLQRLTENLEEEIAFLKTVGASYVICPYLSADLLSGGGEAFWQDLFKKFAAIGKRLKEEGLEFAYHNHDFEFASKIDGEFVFDAMYNHVDADLLKVEMDIGWVQYAKQDPLAYIAKYKGRLPLVHLKDFRKSEGKSIDTVELGQGDLALNDIIAAAKQADVEWLIVEQDTCANPPLESVQTSMNWLKENGYKA